MSTYLDQPDEHLDPAVASIYDAAHAARSTPEALRPMLDVLTELSGEGSALEFAVGTGRVALPLAERGVAVFGMDFSEAMLSQLRAKPGSETITASLGDMRTAQLGQNHALVYLVFNTIMNVRTQQDQVEVFRNAARHLQPGGHFAIEVVVPEIHRLSPGETLIPFDLSDHHVGVSEYVDMVNQIVLSHHWSFLNSTSHRSAPSFRYVWPSELDLMAKLAGLEFVARWADWTRAAFTGDSRSQVSVWRKPLG